MRIIAGIAKGRKLLPPEGMETTRPTLDRVKEAMFSMIQNRLEDALVLDVFAGTGSLGLESVSRGAKQCVLVDRSPVTFDRLKKNVENLKFQDQCICLNMDSYEALEYLAKESRVFDIIFIDPPYLKDMIPRAIDVIHQNNMLDKDGIIVTKIDSSERIYEGNGELLLSKYRKYGNTTVCLYKYIDKSL
ncbi:16S rRNA (guanine(966)-N(2))-methyltransferase RsmD [Clostridium thermarum]|uniref:16S rRNA (guanine(966)-N(2))-methyltransferase RsmD n=1 Tax=Clostridium thermarum TaxID=1716543 RepID=UPI001120D65D|nr:16S rRNA (guanine(966)-N(2))-methyltransferase RsmD [Clostridium thermarum]